jgi:hypothetical protein
MRPRTAVLGGLGVLLTGIGWTALWAPELVAGLPVVRGVTGGLSGVDPTTVTLLAGAIAGLALAVAARTRGTAPEPDDDPFAARVATPPEAVTADRRRETAAGLERTAERAVETGGRPLEELRSRLAATAAAAYAEAESADRERARRAVETGSWTDDPVAAAVLAADGPTPPVAARLRLWLAPGRERRRRIERTVRAIERLVEP